MRLSVDDTVLNQVEPFSIVPVGAVGCKYAIPMEPLAPVSPILAML